MPLVSDKNDEDQVITAVAHGDMDMLNLSGPSVGMTNVIDNAANHVEFMMVDDDDDVKSQSILQPHDRKARGRPYDESPQTGSTTGTGKRVGPVKLWWEEPWVLARHEALVAEHSKRMEASSMANLRAEIRSGREDNGEKAFDDDSFHRYTSPKDAKKVKAVTSPVRKKKLRRQLQGTDCPECRKFYEDSGSWLSPETAAKLMNKCSRHRHAHPPARQSPQDFMKLSPSTWGDVVEGNWEPLKLRKKNKSEEKRQCADLRKITNEKDTYKEKIAS